MALIHVVAVAAAAVQLAKVIDGEVGDRHCTRTVVLDYLVTGTEGTTSLDVGRVTAVLKLDGERILANG